MAQPEGSIPCLHALALAVFERSQIAAGQAEHLVSITLGERPSPEATPTPRTVYDALVYAHRALEQIHENQELLVRQAHPSEELSKFDAQPNRATPMAGEPAAVEGDRWNP